MGSYIALNIWAEGVDPKCYSMLHILMETLEKNVGSSSILEQFGTQIADSEGALDLRFDGCVDWRQFFAQVERDWDKLYILSLVTIWKAYYILDTILGPPTPMIDFYRIEIEVAGPLLEHKLPRGGGCCMSVDIYDTSFLNDEYWKDRAGMLHYIYENWNKLNCLLWEFLQSSPPLTMIIRKDNGLMQPLTAFGVCHLTPDDFVTDIIKFADMYQSGGNYKNIDDGSKMSSYEIQKWHQEIGASKYIKNFIDEVVNMSSKISHDKLLLVDDIELICRNMGSEIFFRHKHDKIFIFRNKIDNLGLFEFYRQLWRKWISFKADLCK